MDYQNFLFYLFAVVSSLYIVHFGCYLVAANFYDIWQYRRRYSRHTPERSTITQHAMFTVPETDPLVTIAIPAHNEEKVIIRCLESIRRGNYRNIEVLVADDASSDHTRALVKDYMQRYPSLKLQVYRMRRNIGKGKALNTVLRRYARGTLVMSLDADSIMCPDAITNAISYFSDPNVAGVAANVQILDEPTVLGVLQKFEHMVGYRSKKMYSLLNCEFVVGGVASTYRMSVLRQVGFYDTDTVTEDIGLSTKITRLGNRTHRMVYAADVVAMTEPVASFRALVCQRYRWKYGSFQNLVKYRSLLWNPSRRYTRSLTMYRLPMAVISEFVLLLSPVIWIYILYMTLVQYDLTLVVGAYCTITAYTLVTVWFDENLGHTSRLRLTAYSAIAYFIYYVMDLVQLIAIVRCVVKSHLLIRQKSVGSVWVSPKRMGKQVVVQQ